MKNKIIVVSSRISEFEFINETIEAIQHDWGISDDVIFSVNLALDEIVSNIINHGYKYDEDFEITIRFSRDQNSLRLQVKDYAPPFNPLEVPEPDDLNKDVEDRKIGGLGIHLAKKFTDNIAYRRYNEKNIVTFVQKL
jgi:anti-sigma regulatory factor (Ser/Thr protein kinase)